MGDEMLSTDCKGTRTCDTRVERRTQETVQGRHNRIDPGAQAASVLEKAAPTMGSGRRLKRHVPPASPGLFGAAPFRRSERRATTDGPHGTTQ